MFIFLGLLGHFSGGFEKQWIKRQDNLTQYTYSLLRNKKRGWENNGDCRFYMSKITDNVKILLHECYRKYGKGFAIIGDSHARDLYGLITSSNPSPFIVGIIKEPCRPLSNKKCIYKESFLNFITESPAIFKGVIWEQIVLHLLKQNKYKHGRPVLRNSLDDTYKNVGLDVERITAVYVYLKKISQYTRVLWLGSRIEPRINERMIVNKKCSYEFKLPENQEVVFKNLDNYIASLVKKEKNVKFISQSEVFNYSFPSDFMSCKEIYWSDGHHLSVQGMKRFGKRYDILKGFEDVFSNETFSGQSN